MFLPSKPLPFALHRWLSLSPLVVLGVPVFFTGFRVVIDHRPSFFPPNPPSSPQTCPDRNGHGLLYTFPRRCTYSTTVINDSPHKFPSYFPFFAPLPWRYGCSCPCVTISRHHCLALHPDATPLGLTTKQPMGEPMVITLSESTKCFHHLSSTLVIGHRFRPP